MGKPSSSAANAEDMLIYYPDVGKTLPIAIISIILALLSIVFFSSNPIMGTLGILLFGGGGVLLIWRDLVNRKKFILKLDTEAITFNIGFSREKSILLPWKEISGLGVYRQALQYQTLPFLVVNSKDIESVKKRYGLSDHKLLNKLNQAYTRLDPSSILIPLNDSKNAEQVLLEVEAFTKRKNIPFLNTPKNMG